MLSFPLLFFLLLSPPSSTSTSLRLQFFSSSSPSPLLPPLPSFVVCIYIPSLSVFLLVFLRLFFLFPFFRFPSPLLSPPPSSAVCLYISSTASSPPRLPLHFFFLLPLICFPSPLLPPSLSASTSHFPPVLIFIPSLSLSFLLYCLSLHLLLRQFSSSSFPPLFLHYPPSFAFPFLFFLFLPPPSYATMSPPLPVFFILISLSLYLSSSSSSSLLHTFTSISLPPPVPFLPFSFTFSSFSFFLRSPFPLLHPHFLRCLPLNFLRRQFPFPFSFTSSLSSLLCPPSSISTPRSPSAVCLCIVLRLQLSFFPSPPPFLHFFLLFFPSSFVLRLRVQLPDHPPLPALLIPFSSTSSFSSFLSQYPASFPPLLLLFFLFLYPPPPFLWLDHISGDILFIKNLS